MSSAIETPYKGYRFRSRLEARWAVFYDNLDLEWEYEKEGFKLKGQLYLPDFFIPRLDCWIEIKGQKPSEREQNLARLLARETDRPVFIFFGQIPYGSIGNEQIEAEQSAYMFSETGGADINYQWTECPDCRRVGIEFEGRSDRLYCKESYSDAVMREQEKIANPFDDRCPRRGENLDKGGGYDSERLLAAYQAARSARFEHGETP